MREGEIKIKFLKWINRLKNINKIEFYHFSTDSTQRQAGTNISHLFMVQMCLENEFKRMIISEFSEYFPLSQMIKSKK